jgi:hypothetical protein
MHRLAATLAICLGAVVPAVVSAVAVGAAQDGVSGAGWLGGPGPANHFEISAKQMPDGTAKGQVRFKSEIKNAFDADVICLRVVGNRASILAALDNPGNPRFDGGGFLMYLEDNGNGQSGVRDRQRNTRLTETEFEIARQAGCPDPTLAMLGRFLERGNITVRDANSA